MRSAYSPLTPLSVNGGVREEVMTLCDLGLANKSSCPGETKISEEEAAASRVAMRDLRMWSRFLTLIKSSSSLRSTAVKRWTSVKMSMVILRLERKKKQFWSFENLTVRHEFKTSKYFFLNFFFFYNFMPNNNLDATRDAKLGRSDRAQWTVEPANGGHLSRH